LIVLRRVEQLDRVAGRILNKDLLASVAGHYSSRSPILP
jgi:hypothetical protein